MISIIKDTVYDFRLLTGIKITTFEDTFRAMDALHAKGVKTVILSSTSLGKKGYLAMVASMMKGGI